MSLYTSDNDIRRPLSYLGGLISPKFPDAISGSFTGLEFGFITIAGTVDPNDFTSQSSTDGRALVCHDGQTYSYKPCHQNLTFIHLIRQGTNTNLKDSRRSPSVKTMFNIHCQEQNSKAIFTL